MVTAVLCPECNRALEARPVVAKRPHSWNDLVYRCEDCGWGWSNARLPSARRRITREPWRNVPEEVRDGLGEVLAGAVNVRNQKPKAWKFCSETSEDAVTWTVVRGLQQLGKLELLLPPELRSHVAGEPSVLLWGVPAGGDEAQALAKELESVSTRLHENPRSRTEPDVILAWRELLVVVEAKLGSRNERKAADYAGWPLYTDSRAFTGTEAAVAATGLYELVRNWRFGWELAGTRPFLLMNLGRESLEADAWRLGPGLSLSERRMLRTRQWSEVIPDGVEWFRVYAEQKKLLT